VKVLWSENAQKQLGAIHDYIAHGSELYARRTVDRLTSRTKQIARFPNAGRVVPEFESETIREVIEGSYRIIYQINDSDIVIAAVVHTAREPPWR
jgi:toxin ParE1/3/4